MINLNEITIGERLRLTDGRHAVVVENMGDGQWLEVRFSEDDVGEEPGLVHSQDVAERLLKTK